MDTPGKLCYILYVEKYDNVLQRSRYKTFSVPCCGAYQCDRSSADGIAGREGIELVNKLKSLIKLARPKQWIKNLFVFAAVIFSGNLFHLPTLGKSALGFLAFCLTCSSVYVFNDIIDRNKDRNHPKKCMRPIASGAVSVFEGAVMAALLFLVGVGLSFYLNIWFGAIVLAYIGINLAYSLRLKREPILDIMCIAVGFVLRAISGAALIRVMISPWLILCSFMLSLFLAIQKRMGELEHSVGENKGDNRAVLLSYTPDMLRDMNNAINAGTIICYCLYTVLQDNNIPLMCSIPFVIYGIFRYQYISHVSSLTETPENAVLKDIPLLVDLILWVLVCMVALYVF